PAEPGGTRFASRGNNRACAFGMGRARAPHLHPLGDASHAVGPLSGFSEDVVDAHDDFEKRERGSRSSPDKLENGARRPARIRVFPNSYLLIFRTRSPL